jgi:hypothetical protein
MDYNSTYELREQLDTNEQLIWTGQPMKGIAFTTADFFLIPFSVFWCGFSIYWVTMAWNSGAPFFFVLFGVPFVAIGLILVFDLLSMRNKEKKHTMA